MLKFIPNNFAFELDLTYLNVIFNETNSMFDKEFSSEFTFPFTMSIDFWQKQTNLHYNAKTPVTQFPGKLDRDGRIIDTTLKISSVKGSIVEGTLFAGLAAFPNFETSLTELDLAEFDVDDLYEHAETIIVQDYPDVEYNFGMVHTDKYDPESDEFNSFEKILNKYIAGAYVENVLQVDSNIDLIKNTLQPFPYLLYVLKKGFQEVGMELVGDVLNDIDLQRALIFRDGNYYKSTSNENIHIQVPVDEYISVEYIKSNQDHVKFVKDQVITKKGDYILFGDVNCVVFKHLLLGKLTDISLKIFKVVGGVPTEIYSHISNGDDHDLDPEFYKISTFNRHIDIDVSVDVGDIIRIEKIEPKRDQTPSITPEYPDAIFLDLIPIRYRNPDGSPIMTLLPLNKIDLKLCVPDITFGELVQQIRIIKNLDFVPEGNTVTMNYINLNDRTGAIPFDETEVEEPLRKFHDERSYEIIFSDGKSNAAYPYDSLFIDKNGIKTNTYKTDENTTQILIDALPYPVIDREGIKTAFAFDDETSKLRLIFYKAPDAGESPLCFDNPNMLIPALYANHYINWIYFLINSTEYEWEFIIAVEKYKDYTIRSLIYAYDNFHLFTEIEKERIVIATNHYYQITARSESLV